MIGIAPGYSNPWSLVVKFEAQNLLLMLIIMIGLEINFQVLDPRVAADSSTVLECASRSIETALQMCEDLGVRKPDQLLAWVS